jgi:hypothetical protein
VFSGGVRKKHRRSTDDATGRAFVEALAAAARRGVCARVLSPVL